MKLLDVLRKFRHDGSDGVITTPAGADKIKAEVDKATRVIKMREDIQSNPSLYNRATRRLHGFLMRAVPREYVQPESSYFVPRYVRRHALHGKPVTRRQRKAFARMTRLAARYGAKP